MQRVKLDALDKEIYFAFRSSQRYFNARARIYGLRQSQSNIIGRLSDNPAITQIELADDLDVSPIVLSNTLKKLEQDGLVERRFDPKDRRILRLFLTPKAQPIVRRMEAIARALRSIRTKGFSESEMKMAIDLLRRMNANLEEERKSRGNRKQARRVGAASADKPSK